LVEKAESGYCWRGKKYVCDWSTYKFGTWKSFGEVFIRGCLFKNIINELKVDR